MQRIRNWCFTLNNPTPGEYRFWNHIADWEHRVIMRYAILQEEEGENGTIHLQGYIELNRPLRLRRMKRLFGNNYHFEKRRGTQAQAITYCKKRDTRVENGLVVEWGNAKRGGGKFVAAVEALKGGMDIEEVEDEFAEQFVRFRDNLEDYYLQLQGGRDWAMDIQIYVGASGTGKSYTAQNNPNRSYTAPWPTGGRWWWPGYRGEHTVIMDEFRHQIKMDVMLKMMDRYAWHLEAKGRNFKFCSRQIIITTNIDPKDWYPGLSTEKKEPLARRIQEFATIWDFSDTDVYPNFRKVERTEGFEFNAPHGFGPGQAAYNGGANYGGA